MKDIQFSFKKELKNSKTTPFSQSSRGCNINNSSNLNKKQTKHNRIKKLGYFDIYNQIKEEMNNKINFTNLNSTYKPRREEILDNLYLKNTTQINNYYSKNYLNIEIQGTKDLEGIYKEDLSSEVKNNQSNFITQFPLKYRNPVLNKDRQKVNCTPIPFIQNKADMNEYEKKELDKVKRKAIFLRKMEYTHANPPPKPPEDNKKKLLLNKFYIINQVRLIQKWYRFVRKNRSPNYKTKLKSKLRNKNKNKDNNEINNKKLINRNNSYRYYQIQNESFGIYNNNEDYINILNKNDNNINDKNNNLELNNKTKNNLGSKKEIYPNNNIKIKQNISFEIVPDEKSKNLFDEYLLLLKPINNDCYISKGDLFLINNSEDMKDLNLIQKNIKNFLRKKNQISPYRLYKQIKQNEKLNNNILQNNSNNSLENNSSKNINSENENINDKKTIFSQLDSLQSIHDEISMKETVLNDKKEKKSRNDINQEKSDLNNLFNFSFNSEKNKPKSPTIKLMQINKDINKNYFISKKIIIKFSDLILKIQDLQFYIKRFLRKKKNKSNTYTENSSSIYYSKNESLKYNINNFEIEENNNFYLYPQRKTDKTKLLRILLNKYNKKLNKEVNNIINLYHNKNREKNNIIKITKRKLPITLVKIINDHLRGIFNDIYKYKTINYQREYLLLKIFNNINSRLKRYFFRWSNRPLKLLIYKTKSVKYYNSLNSLNNNIKKLIKAIYNIFITKYFYILIIYYLYLNKIDIKNIKIISLLNNKKKLKMFYEISKNIHQNRETDDNLNKLNILDYFKTFENINNNKSNLDSEEEKEENIYE